ncbi:hypothetical protein DQ04_00711010 [Trypanosoma grayi]|uniref:hypothetical protein n=1 Tax=Trypanosoma grayi TaxID=71804 RepID=UPI0004F41076|nr:hypothetical protein DQ04_00711010 [Trypanosoma grayi]KEG13923.1 hypothetical protein DQ04_00711010 [Trypanosoma grayi]
MLYGPISTSTLCSFIAFFTHTRNSEDQAHINDMDACFTSFGHCTYDGSSSRISQLQWQQRESFGNVVSISPPPPLRLNCSTGLLRPLHIRLESHVVALPRTSD